MTQLATHKRPRLDDSCDPFMSPELAELDADVADVDVADADVADIFAGMADMPPDMAVDIAAEEMTANRLKTPDTLKRMPIGSSKHKTEHKTEHKTLLKGMASPLQLTLTELVEDHHVPKAIAKSAFRRMPLELLSFADPVAREFMPYIGEILHHIQHRHDVADHWKACNDFADICKKSFSPDAFDILVDAVGHS